jgi:hypothetical protein
MHFSKVNSSNARAQAVGRRFIFTKIRIKSMAVIVIVIINFKA